MWTNVWWITTAVVLIVLGGMWWRGRTARSGGYPYACRDHLLGAHGRRFLKVLDQVVGPDVRVFAQVRMTDVMRVTHRPGSGVFAGALARIASRRFDFVLCDRDSLALLCAITLDEPDQRDAEDTSFAQSFPAQMCRFAGLPLLRVIARRDYDLQEMGDRLQQAMQRGRAHDRAADTAVTMAHASGLSAVPPAGNAASIGAPPRADASGGLSILTPTLLAAITRGPHASEAAPTCPRCGATMRRRHVRLGARPDGEFWGCGRFPVCRAIIPIDTSESRAG